MKRRNALAVLFLLFAALPSHADGLEGPVTLTGDGVDVSFYPMPKCVYVPSGSRVEEDAQLKRMMRERCGGAPASAIDLARRSLVAVSVSLDCHGSARIVVRRDDDARLVEVHTTRFDGGCRAMGRGGLYWISMPKVPEGYSVVLTGSRVERYREDGTGVSDRQAYAPSSASALARAAAATLVTIETFDSAPAGDRALGHASGFAMRDGRVVTSARAMRWAVSARVRRPGSARSLPVAAVAGLDLAHDFCVLEVPGLDAKAVPTAELTYPLGGLFVAGPASSPEPGAKVAIELDGVYVRSRDERGLVELSSFLSAESLGAPVVDASGRVVGVATTVRGRNGYSGFLVPAALFDAPAITTRMPVSAAGYLTRTDAEAAGFIYGRVHRVTETVRDVDRDPAGGASDRPPGRVSEWVYDGRGMVTRHSWSENGVHQEVRYEYDARGLVVLVTERDSRWREHSRAHRVSEADTIAEAARYGGPTRVEERLEGGGKLVRQLDRNGALVRSAEFDAARRLVAETVFTEQYGLVAREVRTKVKRDGAREIMMEAVLEYEYDRLSHWTRRTRRERRPDTKGKAVVTEVAERTIEYHD